MKEKFNTKRFLITVGIVLITAIAVGGATWWAMNKQIHSIKLDNSLEKVNDAVIDYCSSDQNASQEDLLLFIKSLYGIEEAKIEDQDGEIYLHIGYKPNDADWATNGYPIDCFTSNEETITEHEETSTDIIGKPNTTRTYLNEKYGYRIDFDEKWRTYRTRLSVETAEMYPERYQTIGFEVPLKDRSNDYNVMFYIEVMSEDEYNRLKSKIEGEPDGTILITKNETYYYTYTPNGSDIENAYGITSVDIKKAAESLKLTN